MLLQFLSTERFNTENKSALSFYITLEECLLTGEYNDILKQYPEIYTYQTLPEAVQIYKDMKNDIRCMCSSVLFTVATHASIYSFFMWK